MLYYRSMSNRVTILRKVVNNNIPMFSDESIPAQNKWFRVMDLRCVDVDPGQTARMYELENAPNNRSQDTTSYYNFSFDSAHQQVAPPYDIKEGDYVAYKQVSGEIHYWRIVRREVAQMFHNCCVYILTCNVTNPREVERALECGVLTTLTDEEIDPDSTTDPEPTPDPDDGNNNNEETP